MGILKVYFVMYFKFIVIAATAGIFQKRENMPFTLRSSESLSIFRSLTLH